MSGSSLAIDIRKVSGNQYQDIEDSVAVEEPLEIQLISGHAEGAAAKSISITMRTPGHDDELALGFLFTEGIITSFDQLVSAKPVGPIDADSGMQNTIRIEVRPDVDLDIARLERHFYTTSSCGVCGKSSLDALKVSGTRPFVPAIPTFSRDIIHSMPDRLRKLQKVFTETGGLHAAALFNASGEVLVLREDVGRHNAVDKVVGWMVQKKVPVADGLGLFVSGRASFELMQKSLVAGVPLLAAVGAPSSLAVRMAREFEMTLIGFLRDGRFNLYSGHERIQ